MSHINREQTEDAIRKYADQKHSNGEPIEYVNGILKSISVINEQSSADVEEVKHGYWKTVPMFDEPDCDYIAFECSCCGNFDVSEENYCSMCGAKIDGGNAEQCLK